MDSIFIGFLTSFGAIDKKLVDFEVLKLVRFLLFVLILGLSLNHFLDHFGGLFGWHFGTRSA